MPVKSTLLVFGLLVSCTVFAQKPEKEQPVDSLFTDYDILFNELDALLDSLTAPRDFVLFDMALSRGNYNYTSKNSYLLEQRKKWVVTPSLGYFSKSGLGISATSAIIRDEQQLNPYQLYVTGSYDLVGKKKFIAGTAFTRFFTKRSLPFYTSPLKNEAYLYFTYKKLWIKPTVAMSYGWGSRSDFSQQEEYIYTLQLRLNGFTRTRTQERISDFNFITSVRHDFYWLDIFDKSDYIRLTPQVVFTSGTQQFGFNQSSNTYATIPRTGSNVLYSSDNVVLDNELYFQPLSLTVNLKGEYARGKFFLQPQLMLDYYFPAREQPFNALVILNAGVLF